MKAFVSCEIADVFKDAIGIEPLPLKPYSRFNVPVSSHPDMLINIIEGNIFCYRDYYFDNKNIFDEAEREGYNIVLCTPPVSSAYPDDIGLNMLVVGKRIFGNIKHMAKELYDFAIQNGYEPINIKQGYAACCTLVLDENNVITGDITVKKALEKCGISVLFIEENSISLKGYNKGFIGGASGVVCDRICFFGDFNNLDSRELLLSKIHSLKMKEFSIMSGDVYDFGGIKLI